MNIIRFILFVLMIVVSITFLIVPWDRIQEKGQVKSKIILQIIFGGK
jgi:hypothetical protein